MANVPQPQSQKILLHAQDLQIGKIHLVTDDSNATPLEAPERFDFDS